MISSKADYHTFLKEDAIAHGLRSNLRFTKFKEILYPDYIWKFQKRLRITEYYKNCKTSAFGKIQFIISWYFYKKLSLKLGFSIPLNVFGPGLGIMHYGTIIVNPNAKIGKNCRIHACTNIGASGGTPDAPKIGDNVYIGPGVKIYGDIILANNIAIAANAAVGKSFLEENILIGGVPAKKIKEFDISLIIKHIPKDVNSYSK